jgi:hypothetical protein
MIRRGVSRADIVAPRRFRIPAFATGASFIGARIDRSLILDLRAAYDVAAHRISIYQVSYRPASSTFSSNCSCPENCTDTTKIINLSLDLLVV